MSPGNWKIAGRILLLTGGTTAAFLSSGCQRPADAHAAKTTDQTVSAPISLSAISASAPAVTNSIDFADKGAHIQYPSTWTPRPDKDFDLRLVPAAGPGSAEFFFDVPDLPPHFPGMIRIGLIENGYLDDLKKKHHGVHVDSSADNPLPDGACKARLVQSSWKENGVSHSDIALLIMRKEVVYTMSCDADAANLAATRADFDKIAASLRWDK